MRRYRHCACLLYTSARTGIVLRALTADRKTDTVADAAVATDVHQSLDVQLNGRAELAFDLESLLGDGVTDRGDLVVAPLLNLQFGICLLYTSRCV